MGLVSCPDCHRQVSPKASSCVECGAPIAAQTIEATGKRWKLLQVGGVILISLGVCGLCSDASSSSTAAPVALTLLAGLVLTVWGRVGAWWYHA